MKRPNAPITNINGQRNTLEDRLNTLEDRLTRKYNQQPHDH